jgi:hypothetical protein
LRYHFGTLLQNLLEEVLLSRDFTPTLQFRISWRKYYFHAILLQHSTSEFPRKGIIFMRYYFNIAVQNFLEGVILSCGITLALCFRISWTCYYFLKELLWHCASDFPGGGITLSRYYFNTVVQNFREEVLLS